MLQFTTTVILALLCCFTTALESEWKASNIKRKVHNVTTFDDLILTATSYQPAAHDSSDKVPLVIFPNSWGIGGREYTGAQEHLARNGYIAFAYVTRGWFHSDGFVDVAGPKSIKDAGSVIEFCLKTFPNADRENIAFVGISYGGGIGLLTAAQNHKVKTAVSMSGWMSMIKSLDWNNSPSLVFSDFLDITVRFSGRPIPQLSQLFNNLITHTNMTYTTEWASLRSVETFQSALEERQVPVFISNNMQDNLFHSNNELDWFTSYKGPKKLVLPQGTHAEPESAGKDSRVYRAVFEWLDFHLKGVPNGVMDKDLVNVELQTGPGLLKEYLRFNEAVWPPVKGYSKRAYTFGPRPQGQRFGSLDAVEKGGGKTGNSTIVWSSHTEMTLGIPVITAAIEPFVPFHADLMHTKDEAELVFRSKPLEKTTRVCGVIRVEGLTVASSETRFQVYGYAFDQPIGSTAVLMGHTTRTEWDRPSPNVPFTLQPMEFRVTCYDVMKGHRLIVGFNLHNVLYAPASKTASVTFMQDNKATVTFPVLDI